MPGNAKQILDLIHFTFIPFCPGNPGGPIVIPFFSRRYPLHAPGGPGGPIKPLSPLKVYQN